LNLGNRKDLTIYSEVFSIMCLSQRVRNSNTIAYVSAAAD